ncbi:hypothetical protein POM88_013193 [Heracleum sosnowskyi]|uniref:DUF6598 domain-containing protein n=1 Tax=Heracleum sosnowskyi TaxID=360622 RepID=A0AAD8J1C8_9APIA|nr:hypothetical protein POM88_013193 [Heracleum sosnowskyi]
MERSSRQSMDLAEVYRVKYNGPVDHLRGAILTSDVDTGFQLLFKDKALVPLKRVVESEDGNQVLTMLYAFFENAVEAHVEVKITGVESDFDLYGVITARTSAITETPYSSILFFKDEEEKMSVKRGDGEIDIDLSRRIVGVPLGSQLILQFYWESSGGVKEGPIQHQHMSGQTLTKIPRPDRETVLWTPNH